MMRSFMTDNGWMENYSLGGGGWQGEIKTTDMTRDEIYPIPAIENSQIHGNARYKVRNTPRFSGLNAEDVKSDEGRKTSTA